MKASIKRLLLTFPPWRSFDFLVSLIYFFVAHRRLPSRQKLLFNDYLFWLKISRDLDYPLRQYVSDKELVKNFYRGVFLKDVAPKTLLCFYNFEEFVKTELPTHCVIKPAHLSGCIFLDRTKRELIQTELTQISSWFSTNIYEDISRERNYRTLKASVICEEMVTGSEKIKDYKIFCYHGEPRAIQVDVDRHTKHRRRLYTNTWQPLPFAYNKPLAPIEEKPAMFDEALRLARAVAKHFPFIRVDVYLTHDRVLMGELTSIPENAHGRFEPLNAERQFMKLLTGS